MSEAMNDGGMLYRCEPPYDDPMLERSREKQVGAERWATVLRRGMFTPVGTLADYLGCNDPDLKGVSMIVGVDETARHIVKHYHEQGTDKIFGDLVDMLAGYLGMRF